MISDDPADDIRKAGYARPAEWSGPHPEDVGGRGRDSLGRVTLQISCDFILTMVCSSLRCKRSMRLSETSRRKDAGMRR